MTTDAFAMFVEMTRSPFAAVVTVAGNGNDASESVRIVATLTYTALMTHDENQNAYGHQGTEEDPRDRTAAWQSRSLAQSQHINSQVYNIELCFKTRAQSQHASPRPS